MSGIPDNLPTPPPAAAAAAPAPAAAAAAAAASDASPLAALRAHPQFDALRRLVQTNPEQLQAVLAQIGAQTPELLQAINANQNEFIAMMNEPVTSAPAASPTPAAAAGTPPAPGGGLPGGLGGLMGGMANPADIAGLLNNLTPQQRNDMAQAMGMTPQQLEATTQMIQNMPPEAMAQIAAQMGGAGGPGGMGGGGGSGVKCLSTSECARSCFCRQISHLLLLASARSGALLHGERDDKGVALHGEAKPGS